MTRFIADDRVKMFNTTDDGCRGTVVKNNGPSLLWPGEDSITITMDWNHHTEPVTVRSSRLTRCGAYYSATAGCWFDSPAGPVDVPDRI